MLNQERAGPRTFAHVGDARAGRDATCKGAQQIVAPAQGLKPQPCTPWQGVMYTHMRLQPMIVSHIGDISSEAWPERHAGGLA